MPKSGSQEPRSCNNWWEDYDDYHHYYRTPPMIHDVTVFEEDKDDIVEPSGLLAPDGSPIMIIHSHPGMDFIGFINPAHYELHRFEGEQARKKKARKEKRRANALKSKA